MLFVISSNDQRNEETNTGSELTETLTWTQEDLDNLVEMLDNDTDTWSVVEEDKSEENKTSSEEEISEEENVGNTDEDKWFFSRLFWEKDENEDASNENVEQGVETDDKNQNLVKDTQVKEVSATTQNAIETYAPEILSHKVEIDYPGLDLETEVGNEYEVWVYSLKLNNKFFNETLWYMMQGDVVKQLTQENSFGCFEVEVLSAKNEDNVWKNGYVCKKYLSESSDSNGWDNNVTNDTPSVSLTKVWDIITVEKETVLENGIMLSPGDIVDQMSPASENGCFTAHILSSQNEINIVPVANVCLSDIK